MWKSIKKGLSLIGQSFGVIILVIFAIMIFIVILPEATGWGAFLWGFAGLFLLFISVIGIWALGEENKK